VGAGADDPPGRRHRGAGVVSGDSSDPLRVVVVGQGYVGLPLAMRAVEAGHHVVGVEIDEGRAKRLADALGSTSP
jgi:UDP-N-acetyl-D-mannosaminuronate dehydrogenase